MKDNPLYNIGNAYRPVRYVHKPSKFISGDPEKYSSFICRETRTDRELDLIDKEAEQKQIQVEEDYAERRRKRILSKLANVYEVSDRDKKKFIKDISTLTNKIRDFIVLEIAPLEIAVDAAIEEAAESLELITLTNNARVDSAYLRRIIDRLSDLRIFEFVSGIAGINNETKRKLFELMHGGKDAQLPQLPTLRQVRRP